MARGVTMGIKHTNSIVKMKQFFLLIFAYLLKVVFAYVLRIVVIFTGRYTDNHKKLKSNLFF